VHASEASAWDGRYLLIVRSQRARSRGCEDFDDALRRIAKPTSGDGRHSCGLTISVFAGAFFIVVGIRASFLDTETWAASFDCARATQRVEQLICTDATLSALDDKLGAAWRSALAAAPDIEAVRRDERRWLTSRNAGPTATCIVSLYHQRIDELENIGSPSAIQPPSPEPVRSPVPVGGLRTPKPGD
jgi:uncharacterized protein